MTDNLISRAVEKMVDYYQGNKHDVAHFIKVYTYAKTIGELEQLDADTQQILELAAIVHDIACPLCRIKYGNTNGKNQEAESPALVEPFLAELSVPQDKIERISWLVAHHHTYTNVDRIDYQILLEADYLVNADESEYSLKAIQTTYERVFKTESGRRLLRSIYLRNVE